MHPKVKAVKDFIEVVPFFVKKFLRIKTERTIVHRGNFNSFIGSEIVFKFKGRLPQPAYLLLDWDKGISVMAKNVVGDLEKDTLYCLNINRGGDLEPSVVTMWEETLILKANRLINSEEMLLTHGSLFGSKSPAKMCRFK